MIHSDFRCEFYFIRHGESESNATPGLAAGTNFDAPLTDMGASQATLLGERLRGEGTKFDLVYSSSLIPRDQDGEADAGRDGRAGTRLPKG